MNKNIKIIAHRGLFNNKDIIENTIPAFKESIKQKYSFELDVQLTKDNKLVIFHDDDLNRLGGINIKIQDSLYDDIKSIKLLGTDSYIPLFKDILELNRDHVFIDIEVKMTKRIKETISILMNELNGYDNYSIKSFDPRIVRYIKDNYSFVNTGLLVDKKYKNILYNILLHTKLALKYSKCDFLSISSKLLNDTKYMNKIKGYPISIWTILKNEDINYNDEFSYICNNLPY